MSNYVLISHRHIATLRNQLWKALQENKENAQAVASLVDMGRTIDSLAVVAANQLEIVEANKLKISDADLLQRFREWLNDVDPNIVNPD